MSANIKSILNRVTIFYFAASILAIAILGKIIYLQFFTDLKERSKQISVRTEAIEATRGNVFSCNGQMLATSLPYYEIRMDFAVTADSTFKKYKSELARSLAGLYKDKNVNEYEKFLTSNRKNKNKHRYERVGNRYINFIELQQLKKFPIFKLGKNKGGLICVEKTQRQNPYRPLAQCLIGDVNSNDSAKVGIEGAFNAYLQGVKGEQMVQRIAGQSWMPINSEFDKEPKDGYDVITTLDIDIQDAADNALRKQLRAESSIEGGTAIVMEVATGNIKAMANLRRRSDGTYSETYNYALSEAQYPGSTFKLATLIALLDDGHVTLDSIVQTSSVWDYRINGKVVHTFREASGHNYGTISVKKVFEKSSNVGFAKLTAKYYGRNPQKFYDKLHSMGLFQKSLKLQVNGETTPYARNPERKDWNPIYLPQTSIGYEMRFAPIHILTLYNAVANNGKMMRPKFVSAVVNHGQVEKSYPDEVIVEKICSDKTIEAVRKALEGVVDSGTARHLRDSRYTIAGKTGTSQRVVNGKIHENGLTAYQATFAAFFPTEKPKYTIVVALYSQRLAGNFYGGSWAGPVAKEITDKLYETDKNWYNPIERTKVFAEMPAMKKIKAIYADEILSELKIPNKIEASKADWVYTVADSDSTEIKMARIDFTDDKVPSVVNMGLKDAVYLLENMGLKVTFTGKGRVKKQSIEAGAKLIDGQTINLELDV